MEITKWVSKFLIPRKTPKIRLGNKKDGGYVISQKCVDLCDLVVTFGLGNNISFEKDFISKGKKLIGHDIKDGYPNWARKMKLKTYQDFSDIEEVKNASNIVLKIDTEGAEWEFFETMNIDHFNEKVICFAFELHLNMNPKKLPLSTLEKMFDTHYIIHVHGNNHGRKTEQIIPVALEITLGSKKILGDLPVDFQKYPVEGLDYPNKIGKADYELPWINCIKL